MAEFTDLALLAGRILFGGFFLMSGISHITQGKNMIGYAQMKGIPAPALAVYGSGLMLVAGSALVLLGLFPLVGLALIGLFLLGTTPTMHAYWKEQDVGARMNEQVMFMKNTALLGAAVALAAVPAPWAFGI